jgi:hypothetical protein
MDIAAFGEEWCCMTLFCTPYSRASKIVPLKCGIHAPEHIHRVPVTGATDKNTLYLWKLCETTSSITTNAIKMSGEAEKDKAKTHKLSLKGE